MGLRSEPLEAPWYRQPYVWLVIAFPAAAVVTGLATLWISIATYDGLVVDDYYRKGLQINAQIERDLAAQARHLYATIEVNAHDRRLRVVLAGNDDLVAPAAIKVSFLHPASSHLDVALVVPMTAPLTYEAPLGPLQHGRWNVLLEAGDWRLMNRLWVAAGP